MTVGILAQPIPRLPRPSMDDGWDRMRVLWTGWDGSQWDLTNTQGGVFLVRGGFRGLGMPPIEHYRDRSPAVPGAFYRGTSYGPRGIFWPTYMFHDGSSRDFVELDRAFWESLHPEHEGTMTVEVPGVSSRSVQARLETDDDWAPEVDPTFFGWASYGIRLQADQPLYAGEPYHQFWEAAPLVPFFGGTSPGAPIIRISNGRSMSRAKVTNPGDVEVWPTWTIHGPTDASGVTITVAGRSIVIPIPLAEGERVEVDTSPFSGSALRYSSSGSIADVFTALGDVDFEPIPSREEIDLVIDTSGTGNVDVDFTPLYLRAY